MRDFQIIIFIGTQTLSGDFQICISVPLKIKQSNSEIMQSTQMKVLRNKNNIMDMQLFYKTVPCTPSEYFCTEYI